MNKTVWFDLLTDNVVSVLAGGKFPTGDAERWSKYLADTNDGDRVLAVISFPYIDIELEAYVNTVADSGYSYLDEPFMATIEHNEIDLTYVVCVKGYWHGDGMWEIDDWAGDCTVDFSSKNWAELLEKEMVERLTEYAEKHGRSFTEPNFNYE